MPARRGVEGRGTPAGVLFARSVPVHRRAPHGFAVAGAGDGALQHRHSSSGGDQSLLADIDFAAGELHVDAKVADGYVQEWTPKDHEVRTLPLPEQALQLLRALQAASPAKCPYVFMEPGRWEYYRRCVDSATWNSRDLVHNALRRFQTMCRRAGVREFTLHDVRRSCITNWARKLPIHVVQQLAGHADINTTKKYYLSVQPEDIRKAKRVQKALLETIAPATATDQKLTQKGDLRVFEGRKVWRSFLEEEVP